MADGGRVQVAWGSSEWGQCGHESEAVEFSIPRAVKALRGRYVCGVACGAAHTLVLTSTGDVMSCGMGAYGALGHGDCADARHPRLVQVSTYAVRVPPCIERSCRRNRAPRILSFAITSRTGRDAGLHGLHARTRTHLA